MDKPKSEGRSLKQNLLRIVFTLLALYLVAATLVGLRKFWFPPPELASDTYMQALHDRNTAVIYLYSDMLGPRLLDMMAKSEMSDEDRQQLWAKDYARWKSEFQRGSQAMDSLRRERELFSRHVRFERVTLDSYKAEIQRGKQTDLLAFSDFPGLTHHRYYRLTFPSAAKAPPVSVLDNLRTGLERRLKSVVIRVQVRRRPDVNPVASQLMEWTWIEDLAFLFPFVGWVPHEDPSEIWMAGVSFDVDKLTLETF